MTQEIHDKQDKLSGDPAEQPKPRPVSCKEFLKGKPDADPSWVPPRDFGSCLNALAMADNDPSGYQQLKKALLDLAEYLDKMPPLDAIMCERQIRDILKSKRVKPAFAMIKAARMQVRLKNSADPKQPDDARNPA
jgi:hypothetical protein